MIYFAYGSNMDKEQMADRCPSSRVIGAARLAHYTLAFTRWSRAWNSATADILPDREKDVYGVLYDLTLDDLKRMDKIADYPHSYIRQDVFVEVGTEQIPALTYVAIRQGSFFASKAYRAKMVQGAATYKFPAQYMIFLKSLTTCD